jgi:hypothetical protein
MTDFCEGMDFFQNGRLLKEPIGKYVAADEGGKEGYEKWELVVLLRWHRGREGYIVLLKRDKGIFNRRVERCRFPGSNSGDHHIYCISRLNPLSA